MTHYIAVIHKDLDSSFGISFPDVPGVITTADTLDKVLEQAAEVLAFAAEDWEELTGQPFPSPRTLDQLRFDPEFTEQREEAIIAAVPLKENLGAAA